MKVPVFFLFFCLMILSGSNLSGASNPSKKSKNNPAFYKQNIVIDGSSKEWEPSMFLYNKDAAISYAIANDSSSLYYCIKIPDEKQQMKVLRNGMDIWIDPAGKKNKKTGIHFPLGNSQSPGGYNNNSNGAQQKLYYMLQLKQMELTGFRDEVDGFQGTMTNSSGVKAIIKWDSLNVLVYEAKIPFNALKDNIRESDQVSLGFIVNGMHQGQVHHPAELNEEGHGGSMGGQGEGGHHMGGGGGGGYGHKEGMSQQSGHEDADFQKMSEDNIIWHTIGIAKK
jgi:hypothetical protein